MSQKVVFLLNYQTPSISCRPSVSFRHLQVRPVWVNHSQSFVSPKFWNTSTHLEGSPPFGGASDQVWLSPKVTKGDRGRVIYPGNTRAAQVISLSSEDQNKLTSAQSRS
jgi:hypothetical protein